MTDHSGRFSARRATRSPGRTPSVSRPQESHFTLSTNSFDEMGSQEPFFL